MSYISIKEPMDITSTVLGLVVTISRHHCHHLAYMEPIFPQHHQTEEVVSTFVVLLKKERASQVIII